MKQYRNLRGVMATKDHSENEAGFKCQMKKVILYCFMVCSSISLYGQTVNDYKANAEKGDKEAQYNLGMLYFEDDDHFDAFQLFEKAANQGYAPAQFMVGYMIRHGMGNNVETGLMQDDSSAFKWYIKAANQGYGIAAYHLGMEYCNNVMDYKEAQKWLLKAIELGECDAQCYGWLGNTYNYDYKEKGIKRNPAEALKWYKKAAELGYNDSELNYNLGKLSMELRDFKNGEKWLLKVADENDMYSAWAMHELGKYYLYDDINKSIQYLKKAAEYNGTTGSKELGDIYYKGIGGIKIDKTEAFNWYLKSVKYGGDIDEYNKVAKMYYKGEGTTTNYAEALKYFKKSADLSNSEYNKDKKNDAFNFLGSMYLNGQGTSVNKYEALKYFRKGAELGDKSALFNTGLCYHNGWGTAEDKTEAAKWFKKAADLGDDDAQEMLRRIANQKNVVKMKKDGGVYTVPILVNGVEMSFIFDTGASTISISETEVSFLYKQGKLKESDIVGTSRFTDATGAVSEGTIIILRTVKIGTKTLTDIKASVVHNMSAPLLLGQSALEKFGKFTVDYSKGEIIFE